MAGTGIAQGFDATAFRNAILLAMNMSAPVEPNLAVIFQIPESATFSREDPGDNPYDWTATPVTDTAARFVTIPAAVTFGGVPAVSGTALGEFDASKVTLTVLDVQQALIVGATAVQVGGVDYTIDPPGPTVEALFSVDVWTYHLTARG